MNKEEVQAKELLDRCNITTEDLKEVLRKAKEKCSNLDIEENRVEIILGYLIDSKVKKIEKLEHMVRNHKDDINLLYELIEFIKKGARFAQ